MEGSVCAEGSVRPPSGAQRDELSTNGATPRAQCALLPGPLAIAYTHSDEGDDSNFSFVWLIWVVDDRLSSSWWAWSFRTAASNAPGNFGSRPTACSITSTLS